MTAPLLAWLTAQGFVGYCEVPHYGCSIDMVGWNGTERLIVIEMKRSLSRQVIGQAHLAQTITDDVYCATMTQPRAKGLTACRHHGLGILQVNGPGVVRLLAPGSGGIAFPRKAQRIIEVLRRMEPGGLAGVANLAGQGPAQDCERRIEEYRAAHPKATWQEVFDAVPNHYAHARSMQSAMRMVSKRREWKRARAPEATRD